MGCVKTLALTGAAALIATAASAADLPPAMPPMLPPPPVEDFGGWYLRGDIGMSNQRVGSLYSPAYSTLTSVTNVDKGFDAAPFFGLGVGYQFNSWFRMDVTGEYRAKATFHGLDIANAGGTLYPDDYHGSKSEWTFLTNFYADLGTWWCVTPFVGVGVGTSYNTISHFRDIATNVPGGGGSTGYSPAASKWNFAYAAYAGLAYKVTPNVTLELAYRYINLGKATTSDLIGYDGSNSVYNPIEFRDLTSHDVKLGVRMNLDAIGPKQPAYFPLVTKG